MTADKGVRRRIIFRVVQAKSHSLSAALHLEGNPVSQRQARRWVKDANAGISQSSGKRHRKGKVTEDDFLELMHWLHIDPRRTYQQMADYVCIQTGQAYTPKVIRTALKKRNITRKKINPVAFQRDEALRREFRQRLRPGALHITCCR